MSSHEFRETHGIAAWLLHLIVSVVWCRPRWRHRPCNLITQIAYSLRFLNSAKGDVSVQFDIVFSRGRYFLRKVDGVIAKCMSHSTSWLSERQNMFISLQFIMCLLRPWSRPRLFNALVHVPLVAVFRHRIFRVVIHHARTSDHKLTSIPSKRGRHSLLTAGNRWFWICQTCLSPAIDSI